MLEINLDISKKTQYFYNQLENFLSINSIPIIHIAGEAGIGKTAFIQTYLEIISNQNLSNCFIMDSEQKYSLRKLKSILKSSASQKSGAESQNINKVWVAKIHNISELDRAIDNLIIPSFLSTIKKGDIIIINSLSEILKNSLINADDYVEYRESLYKMSQTIFPRLVSLIYKKKIKIIMTHHVSFNPDYESNLPYFFDFMRTLKGLWIFLTKTPITTKNNSFVYRSKISLSYLQKKQNSKDVSEIYYPIYQEFLFNRINRFIEIE